MPLVRSVIAVAISSLVWVCSAVMSLRSPPAKKVFFAEVMTTPVMSSFSASRRSTVAAIESMNVWFMVLAPWLLSSMVRMTTPSASFSQLIMLSLMVFRRFLW